MKVTVLLSLRLGEGERPRYEFIAIADFIGRKLVAGKYEGRMKSVASSVTVLFIEVKTRLY